ncbi:hypothetical protein SAMN05421738_10851 [Algoriella xinjiangensis]|uniref:Uncharacterized protein n=1 Tax=Algoriella xinjiangensis TaxID=684065 RepID=A0A1I4X2L8_9FLAO|nr:hypothetical protein [Algoriella xinjiangensis]SFN20241.1 hypothetical protein SAMN05421738_10851 [Algoriella xinjiangensis]VDH14715.1 Uncharacterised protein [Algoriella xinjiangensis]
MNLIKSNVSTQNKNVYTTQNFWGAIGPGIKIGAIFSNGKTWLIK